MTLGMYPLDLAALYGPVGSSGDVLSLNSEGVVETWTFPTLIARRPLMETFTDDFSSEDTAKWTGYGVGGGPAVVGGQLSLAPTLSYYVITTLQSFDLTSSQVSWQVARSILPGNGSQALYVQLRRAAGTANIERIEFELTGSPVSLNANRYTAGNVETTVSTPYNAAVHKWLRIREQGGSLYWDYSTDGTTWTNLTTIPLTTWGYDVASLWLTIGSGYWGTEPTIQAALLDNINIPPAAATTWPFAGTIPATSTTALTTGPTTYAFAGTVAALGATQANMTMKAVLAGTASATSATALTTGPTTFTLAGIDPAASATTGALTRILPAWAGTAPAVSGTSGDLQRQATTLPFAGTIAALGATQANWTMTAALAGTDAATGATALTTGATRYGFVGTAPASATSSGAWAMTVVLAGTAPATSATVGPLTRILPAWAGSIDAVSATSGAWALKAVLAGSTAGVSAVAGGMALVVRGWTGSADALSATLAAWTMTAALSGTDAATGSTALTSGPTRYSLAGTAPASGATTGTWSMKAVLAGSADATSTTVGPLTRVVPAWTGACAAVSATSGTWSMKATLAGTAPATSTLSGNMILLSKGWTGRADAVSDVPSPDMKVIGQITIWTFDGSIDAVATTALTLTGAHWTLALAGTDAAVSATTGMATLLSRGWTGTDTATSGTNLIGGIRRLALAGIDPAVSATALSLTQHFALAGIVAAVSDSDALLSWIDSDWSGRLDTLSLTAADLAWLAALAGEVDAVSGVLGSWAPTTGQLWPRGSMGSVPPAGQIWPRGVRIS